MPDEHKLSSKAKGKDLGSQAGGQNKKKKEGFKFYTGSAEAMPIGEKVKVKQVERGGKLGSTIGVTKKTPTRRLTPIKQDKRRQRR